MAAVTHPSPSLLPGSRAWKSHKIEALDSFPKVPLSGSSWVWPGCDRDAAVPILAVFPWNHTFCCSLASPEGENVVPTGFWGSEQDWLLLQVVQAVLGQQSLSPCPWDALLHGKRLCSGLG